MRVLFALTSNQEEKIVQTYREKYGENLEVASVYFFKSLIDTVKSSAPFDRIVIHESFEATGKKNKDVLDEYLFNNIDALTDADDKVTIIFLCGEHRKPDDRLLNRLFNMGVYNILIGAEGTYSRVCELIKNPMTKKDAKRFLEVSANVETYEDPTSVPEVELRSIREYFENNINNKDNIISGFDNNLYEQYTMQKLREIIKILPSKVRDVLYVNSDKYRAVLGDVVKIVEVPVYMDENNNIVSVKKNAAMLNQNTGFNSMQNPTNSSANAENKSKKGFLGFLKKDKSSNIIEEDSREETKPVYPEPIQEFKPVYKTEKPVNNFYSNNEKPNVVVEVKEEPKVEEPVKIEIPEEPKVEETFKIEIPEEPKVEESVKIEIPEEPKIEEPVKIEIPEEPKVEETFKIEIPEEPKLEETFKIEIPEEPKVEEPVKIEIPEESKVEETFKIEIPEEPKVEEPVKIEIPEEPKIEEPFKIEIPEEPKVEETFKIEIPEEPKVEETFKIEIPEEPKVEETLKIEIPEEPVGNGILDITFDETVKTEQAVRIEIPEETVKNDIQRQFAVESVEEDRNNMFSNGPQIQTVTQVIEREVIKEVYETPSDYKKTIAFIGAHKTGTTFIINAIAASLTSKGVKTAILDLTQNKDTYSIYASNNSEYKEVAASSIPNLAIGQDVPLKMGDLSIYTGIPRVDRTKLDAVRAIEKIRSQNAVILVDCDFTTSVEIFRLVSNIFVIQDMDILNILPITMFLKELKVRDVDLNKVEIIVNKYVKSTLTVGRIVEALSYYTNPEMTFVNELLSSTVKRFVVSFDEQNYLRYVEALYSAKMNFGGFSEAFKQEIASIVHDIFPISSTADVAQQQAIVQSNNKLLKNIFKKR